MSDKKDKGQEGTAVEKKATAESEDRSIDEIQEEQFELLNLAGQKIDEEKVKLSIKQREECQEVLTGAKYKEPVYIAIVGVDYTGQIFIEDSSKDVAKTAYMLQVALNRLVT